MSHGVNDDLACSIVLTQDVDTRIGGLMGYAIDRATVEDIPQLIELRMDYLTADFDPLDEADASPIEASLPGFFERHLENDLFAYVMRDDSGRIVSVALMLVSEKPANPRFVHGRIGTVFNVYTKPEHRRKGLAREVVCELVEDARRRDLDLVELNATADGYPLYRSIGFTDANLHRPMHIKL